MQNLPTLRQMQYLLALDKHKSFSRAAEACLVTQSTFSAGIAAFEEHLGQKLVNRDRRQIFLTSLGEEVLNRARQLVDQATALTSLARPGHDLTGPLRMGIIPTIAPYLLPGLLPALKRSWPELELHVHEDLSARLIEKLEKGKLDILLLALPFPTADFRQMIIFTEEFVLASTHADTAPVALADIENMDLLLLEEGHCLRAHALDACRTQNPKIRKTFSATSLATLVQMVQHGAGATLLPSMAARPGILPESVHVRRFKDPAPTRDIGLVWKSGTLNDKALENLVSTIKSCQTA